MISENFALAVITVVAVLVIGLLVVAFVELRDGDEYE